MNADFLQRLDTRLSEAFTAPSVLIVNTTSPHSRSVPIALVYQLALEGENPAPIYLTAVEEERRDRLLQPVARMQFARTRSALRELLSQFLNCHPLEVPLAVDEYGKPHVPRCDFQFNVSHTAGLALIALSAQRVGVDVEPMLDRVTLSQLVQRYFSEMERQEFEQLPKAAQVAGFYRGWTGKEAVLKGLGTGIRQLERVWVRLDPQRPSEILGDAELRRSWQLCHWTPQPGYQAAIALETNAPLELIQGSRRGLLG